MKLTTVENSFEAAFTCVDLALSILSRSAELFRGDLQNYLPVLHKNFSCTYSHWEIISQCLFIIYTSIGR
jgi:hypothetical protein